MNVHSEILKLKTMLEEAHIPFSFSDRTINDPNYGDIRQIHIKCHCSDGNGKWSFIHHFTTGKEGSAFFNSIGAEYWWIECARVYDSGMVDSPFPCKSAQEAFKLI